MTCTTLPFAQFHWHVLLWMTWVLLIKSSKQISKVQQTNFFLAHLRPYWNVMCYLLNLLPNWLVVLSAGNNYVFLLVANLRFSVATFLVLHFSYEYLQEFLGYEPFVLEMYWLFCPSRRFSGYKFIDRNATRTILQVHWFTDLCAKFLTLGMSFGRLYLGLKLHT